MNPNTKEWIINGVLLAGIAVFLALIGVGQFSGVGDVSDSSPAPAAPTPSQTPVPHPLQESTYNPDLDRFPLVGTLEIFRDLITPSPTPTPPPPAPAPTPSLQRAVRGWQYQYPNKRFKTHYFKSANREIIIKENEDLPFPDPGSPQQIMIRAKPAPRNRVILMSPDGQTVEFGMGG